ncbi:hypothetical protein [Okeania sp. SIO2B3]|nr:hypothetical protein [Okeania sp. SIO2B3]
MREIRNDDEILYKARHLIENFLVKLKQYRALAEQVRQLYRYKL